MSAINQNFMHSFSYARRQKKGASVLIQIEKYSEGKKIIVVLELGLLTEGDLFRYFTPVLRVTSFQHTFNAFPSII